MVAAAPELHAGARDFPEDRFVTVKDVPVFKAHQRKLPGGRVLKFGKQELQALADRGNARIRETGDYAVVCLGHTKAPGSGPEPKVIGFSGPFRVDDSAGDPVLYADFHVYREDEGDFRRNPRRSPELWLEDKYEDMYLDPIVLLGATAPYLDLGLLYEAERGGRRIVKYAAAAPAAGSVFVRTTDYQAEGEDAMALSQEDLAQIVGAIEQTDWAQWVKQQMATAAPNPEPTPEPAPEPEPKPQYQKPRSSPEPRAPSPDKELQARVLQYSKQVETLSKALETERGIRVNAQRSEKLSGLRMTHAFDLTKELARCDYAKMSDEAFAEHCQTIQENYQRIPVGQGLPSWTPGSDAAAAAAGGDKVQYQKQIADKAMKICLAAADRGEPVNYEAVRDALERGEEVK